MIKIKEAIRIFKNSKMFNHTLMIDIKDLEVTKEITEDKVSKLYHADTLVGINVFDESLTSQFEDGFTYPTQEVLDILNKYFSDIEFTYDKHAYLRVGEVVSFKPVENSDKLNLCDVKVDDTMYSIVCGAANVREGMKTIVALDNALLPTGVKINKGPVLGTHSDGMLCSKRELGFNQGEEIGIIDLNADETSNQSFFEVNWRKYNV